VEDDIAEKLGYTHLISDCKRDPKVEKKIKDKLKKEGIVVKKNNKELNIY
jgi:predicted transcriptional regulator